MEYALKNDINNIINVIDNGNINISIYNNVLINNNNENTKNCNNNLDIWDKNKINIINNLNEINLFNKIKKEIYLIQV